MALATMSASSADIFAPLDSIERSLEKYVSNLRIGDRLRDAVAYSLLGGGKRLRPVLAWHACAAAGGDPQDALPAAVAVELVHCFSLVHDDLPAMDDDDLRRGKPTLHKHAGEAMAILAGDAMMTLAFDPITSGVVNPKLAGERDAAISHRLVRELMVATTGMIVGQVYDTIPGSVPGLEPLARVKEIHRHKTGALIRASCVMGAICAELSGVDTKAVETRRAALARYGEAIGLMFQIVDDVIDETQSAEHTGKRTGKDKDAGKLTYPLAHGGGQAGLEKCRSEITRLHEESLTHLAPLGPAAEPLRALCEFLATRTK
ncbi:MAG: polyprenyl synthetase family protein [Phycisphaerales bacterium]|nr:polyprenyl synthetase family protein [Phycisphaerales bacterium]